MITPVCQSFGALPEHHVTWHTRVNQTGPRWKVLSISSWISSQLAAFPTFSVLATRKSSAVVMVFSFLKCISCVSDDVKVAGFKRFLKHSLRFPRMLFSLMSKTVFVRSSNNRLFDVKTPDDLLVLRWLSTHWNLVYVRNSPKLHWNFSP